MNIFIAGGTGYLGKNLIPLLLERGPLRLGLVTLKQMMAALVNSIENPVKGIKAVDVPEIGKADVPIAENQIREYI